MRFLICYDITDDRRRARVSTALLDYGARLQESVFVATLDDELLARLVERLRKLIDPLADRSGTAAEVVENVEPAAWQTGDPAITGGAGPERTPTFHLRAARSIRPRRRGWPLAGAVLPLLRRTP